MYKHKKKNYLIAFYLVYVFKVSEISYAFQENKGCM